MRLVKAFIVLCATGALHVQAASLPKLHIKQDETSVSGLSSGAYMAVQFHVANSSFVKGAGVVAGGPYFCAQDSQDTATTICSCTGLMTCRPEQAAPSVPSLVQLTNQRAGQHAIDPTSNLATSRVWLFAGNADNVVPPPVMQALESYYRNYVPSTNLFFEASIPAQHAMPTESFGNPCSFRGDPFINDCDFDGAGKLLQWIYGSLNPKNTGSLSGQLQSFDQGEFIANPTANGMSSNGWVYVPAFCEQNHGCRLHVVFHGCKQYPDAPLASGPGGKFGDTFARHSGYNAWADANNIVVLYPQANAMNTGTRLPRANPNGCWDWWGYGDANYSVKSGRQMAAVALMVDRLAGKDTTGPAAYCGKDTVAKHVSAGRASSLFFWWYFATGSGDYLGMDAGAEATLQEVSSGVFKKVNTCPPPV
ncbi:MAG TPA: PHA-depolymerase-like protein [Pseudoduganella sp.]